MSIIQISNVMSNCTDLSITFSSNTKESLKTLQLLLVQFFEYPGASNREWYNILMGDRDPKTGKRITDKRISELMEYVCVQMYVDDVWENDNGKFIINIGNDGFTDDKFWMLVADKYNADLDISCVCSDGEATADNTSYVNGVYSYYSVELTDDEIVKVIRDNCDEDEKLWSDEELLDNSVDYSGFINEELNERLNKACKPPLSIDCENDYLDDLKSFVDSNNDIPKLDEHLVKSGLFKTTVGTEKRRRIEVEINGVKLYADSKHGLKQRKLNVEKLRRLLA
jgi:hypothetical protein